MYTTDLSDEEWEVLEPELRQVLPKRQVRRKCKWPLRRLVEGMLYQLHNGCHWGNLPKDFPPYSTVYWHYKQWREEGSIAHLLELMHTKVRIAHDKKNILR